jgi:hypothetical protein
MFSLRARRLKEPGGSMPSSYRLIFLTFKALRRVSLALLMSVVLLNCPFIRAQEISPERVKTEYDATKNITQITLNPMILVSRKFEELRLGATTSYNGKTRVRPKEIALIFFSLSATNADRYETARKLTITVEDQPFPLGETQRSKQTQNGVFIESMVTVVPTDFFLRISQAKEVTMKLGTTEVKLTSEQISILRVAASYMTQ